MISRRRELHSKNDGEEKENKQVMWKCSKCDKRIPIEDKIGHGQLEKESANNLSERGIPHLYPDLNEDENVLCSVCATNTINQAKERKDYWDIKNIIKKLIVIVKLLLSNFKLFVTIIAVLIAVIVFAFFYNTKIAEKRIDIALKNQTQDEIVFDNELDDLERTYRMQEDRVWYTFGSGIKSVLSENPIKPSSFLLLYDDDLAKDTAICLAQDISKAATKFLMKKEIEPLIYAGADLNENRIKKDPGELLVLLKDKVTRNGAMIVMNLEKVEPKIAAQFHFFCDRYSPLVEKAIYIFTLRLKQTQTTSIQKVAENTLKSLWAKDLEDNVLHPLITRMTGNVIKILGDHSNCYFNAQKLL